ncbi:MAG: hypothetical protein ACI9EF_003874 [Pseudohongiellaceae bacterium]
MSLPETECRQLAAMLGDAVEQVLWPHYEGRVLAGSRQIQLRTRVGGGRATYHRSGPRSQHLIVFGWKMVQHKSSGWGAAVRWRSGKEMVARSYFDGRITLNAVLAHAACHEFAHLIQSVEGGRTRGSVHNRAFYAVLDSIYGDGVADRVLAGVETGVVRARIDDCWTIGAELGRVKEGNRPFRSL